MFHNYGYRVKSKHVEYSQWTYLGLWLYPDIHVGYGIQLWCKCSLPPAGNENSGWQGATLQEPVSTTAVDS